MFGKILGAIAGPLIGGIFGGDKKTTTKSTVDYAQMVKSAEAAGFNPLTALRNGGAAGFSTSTSSGGGPTFGSTLGNAVSAGVDAWQNFDPHKEERAEKEMSLLDAQIKNLNAESDNYGNLNPSRVAASETQKPSKRWALGMSAQETSDEYGDIIGEVQGGVNAAKNLWDGFVTKNSDVIDGMADRFKKGRATRPSRGMAHSSW